MINEISFPQIEKVKNQIIDNALFLGTILGSFAYILSLTRLFISGFEISFITDAIVLVILLSVTILRKKIDLKYKSLVALAAVFLLFIVDTINLGIFSANKVLIILIPFAALMSFNLRKTILISSLALIAFFILAYLHLSGFLSYPPQDNINLSAWLINILLITVVAIVIILVHLKFNNTYAILISNLESSNKIISEKERNYREIFNSSTDAIFIHDLNGNIIDVNDSMLKMYGYEKVDTNRLSVTNLSSGTEDFNSKRIEFYLNEAKNNNPQVFDWQARKKNGELFWVEVALKKSLIGENERILAIVRDINDKKEDSIQLELYRNHLEELVTSRTEELKKVNEELKSINDELLSKNEIINKQNLDLQSTMDNLKETQTQLIQTEKMASLGVLTAGVAHEINNPINYIYNGAAAIELILSEKTNDIKEDLKPYIDAINIGTKRILDIVKSLNRYSRSENAAFTKCNINQVIDECLIILRNQYKDRIEIIKNYNVNEPIINANEGQIHQAFLNILANAIQAIDNEGKIDINIKSVKENFVVSISDTGKGIEEETLKNIFDPFFTTKAPGKGTGLGLSITKSIIDKLNGSIECSSNPGKGTEFIIKLPKI